MTELQTPVNINIPSILKKNKLTFQKFDKNNTLILINVQNYSEEVQKDCL